MILSTGLSPAWQQILIFDRFKSDEVNRARQAIQVASGKVINAARAVQRLGRDIGVMTVVGGPIGEAIKQSLQTENIPLAFVETQHSSRICTTLIDSAAGTITELIENQGTMTQSELDVFLEAFREQSSRAEAVILIGSLPGGTPSSYYRQLTEGLDVPVVADIRGRELLELLPLKPTLVKPNRVELEKTLNRTIRSDHELHSAMRHLNDLGAAWVLISQGPEVLWASSATGELHCFRPPGVDVVNTIGCGDSLTAGIAVGLAERRDMPQSILFGIACSTENALRLVPGDLDGSRVLERMDMVGHQRVT